MADDPTDGAPADGPPGDAPGPQAQSKPPAKGDEAALAEAGRRALDEERTARRSADKALKAAQAELDKLRQASMSEQEKAVAEAKAAGRREALAEATGRLVRSEVRAAAAGKLADPGDAVHLLGDLSDFVDSAGEVDSKAIGRALDALVKAKPYLAPQGSKPAPLPGGGATPSDGFSMDDWLRREARRGAHR